MLSRLFIVSCRIGVEDVTCRLCILFLVYTQPVPLYCIDYVILVFLCWLYTAVFVMWENKVVVVVVSVVKLSIVYFSLIKWVPEVIPFNCIKILGLVIAQQGRHFSVKER